MDNYKGKTVVITGGTRGIGKGLADALAESGANVVVLSRSVPDNGRDSFACDVSDFAAVETVFAEIAALYGSIDVLFNNAGYGQSGAVELIDEKALRAIVDTNLNGVVNCTRAALPYMKEGARIVCISSAAAFVPMPFRTMYSVTKSAVNMFARAMRHELDGTGIQITALCLGDVRTDFAARRDKQTTTSARYGERIAQVDAFVDKRASAKGKADLGKTVKALLKETARRKFRPTRIIGAKWKAVSVIVKILPDYVTDRILAKVFSA